MLGRFSALRLTASRGGGTGLRVVSLAAVASLGCSYPSGVCKAEGVSAAVGIGGRGRRFTVPADVLEGVAHSVMPSTSS